MTGHRSYAERYEEIASRPSARERMAKVRQQIEEDQERSRRRDEFTKKYGITPEEMHDLVRNLLPPALTADELFRQYLGKGHQPRIDRPINADALADELQAFSTAVSVIESSLKAVGGHAEITAVFEDEEVLLKVG